MIADAQHKNGFMKSAPDEAIPTSVVKSAFFGNVGPVGETPELVYGPHRMERVAQLTDSYPVRITSGNIDEHLSNLHDIQVIFSTWGMFPLTEAQLDRLPRLEAMFFAGGTVKHFAKLFLKRKIIVTSAAIANAVPVAEFTLGQILLANKGYFRNLGEYRQTGDFFGAFAGDGNYGQTVSILGAGQIGTKVINLLRLFRLNILVFDPFCSDHRVNSLGAEKVGLSEAFSRGNIVSNHLADVPETYGILSGSLLSTMPLNATFINTGRGRTVNHDDLFSVFSRRRDLLALLDVTEPEPLPLEMPLWKLPNVHVSSHIAGSKGREVDRIADLAIEEFERWLRGEPLLYPVGLETFGRTS